MSKEKSPLFKIIDSINWDKDSDMISEYNDSDYIPYMVNKGMSMGIDTYYHSEMMNRYSFLDKTLQYKYYLYSVKKKKRYNPWAKKLVTTDEIKVIAEYYNISLRKAKDYESLVSSQDLYEMKKYLDPGGFKKEPKKE